MPEVIQGLILPASIIVGSIIIGKSISSAANLLKEMLKALDAELAKIEQEELAKKSREDANQKSVASLEQLRRSS